MASCADARRYSVLIVDDHRDSADTLALLLRLHGHEARVAYNGEQALAVAREWQPEVAVLDIVMSGLDGIELATRLRKEAAGRMLLVALTSLGRNEELAPVKSGAFDDVLLKPVDYDELLAVLDARLAAAAGSLGVAGGASDGPSLRATTAAAADAPVFGTPPAAVPCRKRRAAYAVIIRGDGRVACACRPRGFWLPGGGILPGEGPEDAVKREVREELGWAVRLTGWVGEAVQYFDSSADACWYEMRAYFFTAEFDGEPQGAGDEDPYWLDPDREAGSFFHKCHAWAVSRARATVVQSADPPGQDPRTNTPRD